jgi:CubicO group peptidase (beta-lactamase class C family)
MAAGNVFAALPRSAPGRPGYHARVVRDGKVVAELTTGEADVRTGVPLTRDHVFYVGSLAKQFVAASVALVWRDGSLTPADPIAKFVDGLAPWAEGVTIDQLVHHTGGLPPPPYGPDGLPADGVPAWSTEDRLARIRDIDGLGAAPGERYVYSNAGYTLLAAAVSRAAGVPIASFAHQRLFEPLGMAQSGFRDSPSPLPPGSARGHFVAADGELYVEPSRFHAVGAGGLWTSADDLTRWDRVFLGDDPLTGGWLPSTLLTTGRLNDGTPIHYAWGLSVRTHRGLAIHSHGGSFPGWESKMVRFPKQRTTIIVLANAEDLDVSALAFEIADRVLADELDPAAAHADQTFARPSR